MKAKLKPFLILLITLIIGIAIGFEVSEIMIKIRFDEMKAFREPKSFVKIFDEIIQPENNQRVRIDSILLKYHVKMDEITKQGMSKVSATLDSMKVELKKVLSNDQVKRLEAELSKMKRLPPPPGDKGMPPRNNERPPMDDRFKDGMPPPPPRDGQMPPQGNRPPQPDER